MDSWYDLYKTRLNSSYENHIKTYYAPFISEVAAEGTKYYEFGCGAGFITKALLEARDKIVAKCLDISDEMLELTASNLPSHVPRVRHNILVPFNQNLRGYVIHSHGVLEHFSNKEIRKIIRLQLETGAKRLVHYVPGAAYKTPSRGDERLLTVEQWAEIAKPDRIITFNDGYDYILIWENK